VGSLQATVVLAFGGGRKTTAVSAGLTSHACNRAAVLHSAGAMHAAHLPIQWSIYILTHGSKTRECMHARHTVQEQLYNHCYVEDQFKATISKYEFFIVVPCMTAV
jgi:hypothetical protein